MPTKKELEQQVQELEGKINLANDALEAALSLSPETDNNFFTRGMSDLYGPTRGTWDRKKIFAESLRAWRVNPIARRIVKIMTSFVVGKGLKIKSSHEGTNEFLQEWWSHPKNQLKKNIKRWKDEDTRTGNLFILFNVLENGMTILRAVPAEKIEEIVTDDDDVETELKYTKDATGDEYYPAFDPEAEKQTKFMMHFASNQPVGSPWGEADLSPLLVWIGRFSSWLEDRVRLNRFRTAFMYVVSGKYKGEVDRQKRELELNANPPKSGSVLVMNEGNGEQWGIMGAQLDSFDATLDGTAIKKNILSGIGFPMHWLAEPESSTRTTAEAAGTPTFRTLEEMQNDFFSNLVDMARVAVAIRSRTDSNVDALAEIEIEGPDITERDNATLALALGRSHPQLADMFDRGLLDEKELLRIVYKMIAEPFLGKAPKGLKKPLTAPGAQTPAEGGTDDSDPKEDEE